MNSKLKLIFKHLIPTAGIAFALFIVVFFNSKELHPNSKTNTSQSSEYLNTETSINNLIKIRNVSKKRDQLIDLIWGGDTLPATLPNTVVKNFDDPRFAKLQALAEINKLIIKMEFGLESFAYHFIPKTPDNRFALYHQGHKGDFHHGKSHIEKLLENGYHVIAFCMPLQGLNNQPTVFLERFGNVKLTTHEHLKLLSPDDGHPIKYFIEPVIVGINYIDRNFDGHSISMIGISGGAWTTTLAAAVDKRIMHSFPVAGSYPFYLRVNNKQDWGDYEQTIPELYNTANYLELYVLGAVGDGRLQLQILNKLDSCCFAGTGSNTYKEVIKKRVQAFGTGSFDILLDDTHKKHMISPFAMQRILDIIKIKSIQP